MEIAITLTIVFVVLKFVGVLDWSWWWIFSPLWIGGIITGIMFSVFGAISLVGFIRRGGRTTAGGVFAIICGLFSVISGIGNIVTGKYWELLGRLSVAVAMIPIALGAIALIGGGFTFKRRRWGLALAGAICSLSCAGTELGIPFRTILIVLAILAIVFIALGKREFT